MPKVIQLKSGKARTKPFCWPVDKNMGTGDCVAPPSPTLLGPMALSFCLQGHSESSDCKTCWGWGTQEADECPRVGQDHKGHFAAPLQLPLEHLVWSGEEGTEHGNLYEVLERTPITFLSSPGRVSPRQHFGYKEWGRRRKPTCPESLALGKVSFVFLCSFCKH